MSNNAPAAVRGGRSEYGVALLLLGLGAWAIIDALSLSDAVSRGPVSARTVPLVVGALLVVMGVLLTVDIARGGRGEAEGGEDVDLSRPTDWRTVVPLVAVFAANIVLVDTLGWVVSGALLFFGSVVALGSRHYVRDALVSLVLALGTFYGFYLGLGIHLPAGLLEGVL